MASRRIDSQAVTIHQDAIRLCSVPTETQVMTDCPSCYAYEQELAQLRAQLQRLTADAVPVTPITPMTTVLALSGQQETILSALWKAQGGAISSSAMSIALGGESGKASVRVQVCRIKAALGEGCISNRYRSGYYLTKKGLAKVAQLMETEQ
jgi:hypothetical protein